MKRMCRCTSEVGELVVASFQRRTATCRAQYSVMVATTNRTSHLTVLAMVGTEALATETKFRCAHGAGDRIGISMASSGMMRIDVFSSGAKDAV